MPFTTEWDHDPDDACWNCGKHNVKWRRWESSDEAHEDICYSCDDCQQVYWVEGIDA